MWRLKTKRGRGIKPVFKKNQGASRQAAKLLISGELSCGIRLIFINLLLEYLFLTACQERSTFHTAFLLSPPLRSPATHLEFSFPTIYPHNIFGDVLHDGLQVGLAICRVVFLCG